MSATFEIELKSLLGDETEAQNFLFRLNSSIPGLSPSGTHFQLNHYFEDGSLGLLCTRAAHLVLLEKRVYFETQVPKFEKPSVRTREADGKVYLVIKSTTGTDTSSNGTARLEFESEVSCTLHEIDQMVLESGFKTQAKWSRSRTTYYLGDVTLTLDKNAGYGYLVEVEKITETEEEIENAKQELRDLLLGFGLTELPQDRLERMFNYYNQNWQNYYGTENVFTVY